MVHWNTLSIVYSLDIHFTAAISTIHQSYEWVRFASPVWITLYLSSDALYVIKCFLVDNRLMGVFKNQPLLFFNIMAFFILEMLVCLKVYRMP